jgi:hypothetical protein
VNPLVGILGQAWATYRTHARHLVTIAFVVYVVAALVQLVLVAALGWFGALLAAVVSIVAAFLLQAALVKAVEDVSDGRVDLSLSDTLRAARPFVGRVAIASILAGIAIAVGLVLLIAPGLYLLTIWCLIVPVIVLENATIGGAFDRSRQLVRGRGWQVFGTLVLVFLLLLAVNLVISLVLASLPQEAQSAIAGLISGTLVSPFLAVVVTMAYFRLRSASSTPGGPVTQ